MAVGLDQAVVTPRDIMRFAHMTPGQAEQALKEIEADLAVCMEAMDIGLEAVAILTEIRPLVTDQVVLARIDRVVRGRRRSCSKLN
jgi:hypothetical protein